EECDILRRLPQAGRQETDAIDAVRFLCLRRQRYGRRRRRAAEQGNEIAPSHLAFSPWLRTNPKCRSKHITSRQRSLGWWTRQMAVRQCLCLPHPRQAPPPAPSFASPTASHFLASSTANSPLNPSSGADMNAVAMGPPASASGETLCFQIRYLMRTQLHDVPMSTNSE